MRPIHAILLIVALAAVLTGAIWIVSSDSSSGRIASALPETSTTTTHASTASTNTAPLDAVGDEGRSTGDARVGAPPAESITAAPGEAFGLKGRVVDPEGRAVAGATVYATGTNGFREVALDELDPKQNPWMKRVEGTTDANGRFTLEPVAQGAVRIGVRASGFAPLDVEKPISGKSGDVGDVKLERGVILLGRVIDSSGRPVAGAELHRMHPQGAGMQPLMFLNDNPGPVLATTDASGAFRIDRLSSGPWALSITTVDHPDKIETGETSRSGETVSNLQFTVEDGLDIEGRINGAPATALAELWVRAMPRANEGEGGFPTMQGARRARVQADGTFKLRGTRRGQNYRVGTRAGERFMPGMSRSDSVDAKAGDRSVVLQYRAETAIVCQVVDAETGKPVTSMTVSAGFEWPMPLHEEGKLKPQTSFPEGRVRFASLPQGPEGALATLRIEAAGFQTFERKDLRLLSGQDNDLGEIRLQRASLVRVTVLEDSTGAPIAGAVVTLAEVSPSGRERGLSFAIGIGSDEGDDGFVMQGAAQRGKTDAEGKVAISSLPGKRGTIAVRHRDHALYKSAPIDMPAVGDVEQTVRLRMGGTVVVEVVDSQGVAVPGVSIDHRIAGDDPDPMVMPTAVQDTTDAEGHATFAHLAAGRHLFRIRTGDGAFAMQGGAVIKRVRSSGGGEVEEVGWSEITVAEGETGTLRLVAPAKGTVTGRIREAGKTLAGASIRLEKSGEDGGFGLPFMDEGPAGKSNGEGEYTLDKVTAGEYRAIVSHPSRAMPWKGELTVAEGENRFDVELSIAIVEGQVTGEDKRPLAGVRVVAERAEPEEGGRTVRMGMFVVAGDEGGPMSFTEGGPGTSTTTDADGRYRLRGVTPDVEIQVVASGKDVQRERSEPFKVSADQTRTGVDLVLKLGGNVDVTCRRASGSGAQGCIVTARMEDADGEEPKTSFSGPEGRAKFSGLKPGRWKFTCRQMSANPDASGASIPEQLLDVKVGANNKPLVFDVP